MAIDAAALKRWVDTLSDDAVVYIDEGGLTLCQLELDPDADPAFVPYLEVGGNPAEEASIYDEND
jgi:hypothetical protein